MLKTAITSMRAVVVMVRTNRSQGLLAMMMREKVGSQGAEQKDPLPPRWEHTQTDRQTDRRTDGRTDRQTHRQTQTDRQTHRQTDRQTDGHTDM